MPIMTRPRVLAFDVNETVLDIVTLEPLFLGWFGRREAMREWYAQLILHSQALSLAGAYTPLPALAAGVLRMMGAIHRVELADSDVAQLGRAISTMPAHADVRPGLTRLRDAGLRLVTLTNSAPDRGGGPLARAGVADLFERQFSVDTVRRYKPAPETYRLVSEQLCVPLSQICLVAAHGWDIVGAKQLGCGAALVLRPGNAALPCVGVPQADLVVPDFHILAARLLATEPAEGSGS